MKLLRRTQASRGENGMVLVAVLWTMVLLAMLAAALVMMSRSEARNVTLDQDQLQARETVKAGINLAIVALTDPNRDWPTDGTPRTITVDGVPVAVAITSEGGKVDLNNAAPDLIRGLLAAVGQGPGAADEIANEIVARRQNGGFTSLAELLQLPEIDEDLFDRVTPDLTLYSGSSSVDPSAAPMDVLLAIPGNTRADAEAELAGRTSPDSSLDKPQRPVMTGQAYTIMGKLGASGLVATRKETVRLTGNSPRPIFVLQLQ
jgi:general secretion pathway protein K